MRIPTNIITGFLGVGKTTAILDLLARKGDAERWAVLVNEYGEVSIDEAILAGGGAEGVSVREVAGGCVCCATAPYLGVALHLLLTEAMPHRLIIETTGLGHPAALHERLATNYADRLELRSTVTLVSPDDFATLDRESNSVFREQIEMADVLVLNKLDRVNAAIFSEFQMWANALQPSKLLIAATEQGRLERDWLDLKRTPFGLGVLEQFETIPHIPCDEPTPGQPTRHVSSGPTSACGWRFHTADVFDESRLLATVSILDATRLKGVLRVGDEWLVFNRVRETLTVQPTQYRGESRIEIFADTCDWLAIERELVATLA